MTKTLYPKSAAVVTDVGPWGCQRVADESPAPTLEEWIDRISSHGTILNSGESLPWMKPVEVRVRL